MLNNINNVGFKGHYAKQLTEAAEQLRIAAQGMKGQENKPDLKDITALGAASRAVSEFQGAKLILQERAGISNRPFPYYVHNEFGANRSAAEQIGKEAHYCGVTGLPKYVKRLRAEDGWQIDMEMQYALPIETAKDLVRKCPGSLKPFGQELRPEEIKLNAGERNAQGVNYWKAMTPKALCNLSHAIMKNNEKLFGH